MAQTTQIDNKQVILRVTNLSASQLPPSFRKFHLQNCIPGKVDLNDRRCSTLSSRRGGNLAQWVSESGTSIVCFWSFLSPTDNGRYVSDRCNILLEPAIYQSSGHDSDIDPQLQATRPLDSGKEISLSTERPIEAYVYTDTTISRPAPSSSRVEATSMEKTDREGALSEIPPNLYIHRVESVLHELLAKMPRKLAREEQFSDTERHSKYLLYTLLQCQHLVLDQAVVDRGAAMAITSQERQKARGGICVDCMDAVGK